MTPGKTRNWIPTCYRIVLVVVMTNQLVAPSVVIADLELWLELKFIVLVRDSKKNNMWLVGI